jgi:poly(3-hydroxybutyrate) depolymerase
MRHSPLALVALGIAIGLPACSSSSSPATTNTGGSATGGSVNPSSTGGASATGGNTATGGYTATGGKTATGGNTATGGKTATGGNTATGGAASTGGTSATGGAPPTGGATQTGGAAVTGGTVSTGGATATGGTTSPPDAGTTADAGGNSKAAVPSAGCGKTPTLKNNPTVNTISGNRQFIIRWPTDYDNKKPYRLIFNLHGAGGSATETSGNNYGLWSLSEGSTIFVSLSASGGYWNATSDTTYATAVLKAVEEDLCIDTSRIMLEGFSQGAAMARVLGCASPGVYRAIVGHSAGGVNMPTSCAPIPYLGSLGLTDIMPNSQETQTDPFAKWNGCTIENLPTAPKGSHVCTNYKGCPDGKPVRWCSYDGGHTPSPNDSGKSSSWMPSEVWPFFTQF